MTVSATERVPAVIHDALDLGRKVAQHVAERALGAAAPFMKLISAHWRGRSFRLNPYGVYNAPEFVS